MTTESLAVSTTTTLRTMLEKSKASFEAVLPKHLTADRLFKITLNCVARTPLLGRCSPVSIIRAVMQSAELGLEPGGALGDSYLVPYRNKAGGYDAQFQPGYRGLVRIAIEEGIALKVDCLPVRKGDLWDYDTSVLPPRPIHKPVAFSDAPPVGFYCVVTLPNGVTKVEVMSVAEINVIRDRATFRDKDKKGPWFTDYNEMAKKSVWKRTAKYLGIRPSSKLGQAITADEEQDEELPPMDLELLPDDPPIQAKATEIEPSRPSGPITNLAAAAEAVKKRKTTGHGHPVGEAPPPGDMKIAPDCTKTKGCILRDGHKDFCKGKLPESKPVEPVGVQMPTPAQMAACDACGMATGHVEGCPEAPDREPGMEG